MALKIAKVTDNKTSEQYEALGLRAFEAGDLEKARANFLSALKLNEKNPSLYLRLGTILVQEGTYDKALIAIKRSLELDPYNADAHNAMGVVLYHHELWGAAEKFFRRALELDPKHASAKGSLIEVMKHLRDGDNELPENFDSLMALLDVKEPTLSLCMIVKNEEEFLEDCLASVKDVVDEIIIVDTGSTDRTLEIAERFGAKIHHYAWHGDFASARNESLKYATSDWILVLDADETIPAEWHGELKKALRNKDNIGYSLVIENLLGKRGENRQTALIYRLFQNRPELRYEGIIHEQIILAAERTGMPSGTSLAHIIHRGYLNQYMDQRDKHQRNLKILLDQLEREPENPYVYFNLGQTYKLMEQYEESERRFKECLDLLKAKNYSHTIAYYANTYFSFIELYRAMKEYEKGLAIAEEAIAIYPTYPDVRFAKGHILLTLERYDEAIRCFEECRKFQGVVFAAGNDPSVTTYKSSNALGVAYSRQGKWALAKQHFLRALKEWNHADPETHTNLAIIYLQEGQIAEALNHLTKAVEEDEYYHRAWVNLGTVCFKADKHEEAIAAWRKAKEIAPETPELDFLIAQASMHVGRYTEARAAFEREQAQNPDLPGLRVHLGLAELALGDIDAARASWRQQIEAVEKGDRFAAEAAALLGFASLFTDAPSVPESAVVPSQRVIELWTLATEHLMLAERYGDVERALMAMHALTLPGLAYSIGRLLYMKGLHDAAMMFLLKAREESPEAAEVYYLLGECAVALENLEDARVMYQMALSLNPRLTLARQKLALIKEPQTVS